MGNRLAVVVLLTALVSCVDLAPKYQRPEAKPPAQFVAASPWKEAVPGDLLARGNWWELFGDAQLNELEQQALKDSPRLQATAARVDQARAIAGVFDAALFPRLDLGVDVARLAVSGHRVDQPDKRPGNFPYDTNWFRVPLYVSYEVDLWGKVHNSVVAADARVEAMQAAYQTVLLTLEGEIAQTYFALRTTDEDLRILKRNLDLRQRAFDLVSVRKRGGLASELDLARVDTELRTTQADLQGASRRRVELQNALAVLIGRLPEQFQLPEKQLDLRPPAIPVGLPADLLERRPDVAEAERSLMARNAEIGVARAAYFPSIRLTGAVGYESTALNTLLDRESMIWSIGAAIAQPLFDAGRNRSNVDRAQAAFNENLAQYRERLLVAFQEVENSLSGLDILQQQYELQSTAVTSAQRAEQLATARYKTGLVIVLEVIDAQRTRLQTERSRLQTLNQQMLTSVALIKALGGGWSTAQLEQTPHASSGTHPGMRGEADGTSGSSSSN
jgi:outer membrane protein, multidrug efflux system